MRPRTRSLLAKTWPWFLASLLIALAAAVVAGWVAGAWRQPVLSNALGGFVVAAVILGRQWYDVRRGRQRR